MSFQITRSQIEASGWFAKQEYPFASKYTDLPTGQMHYVDEGSGEPVVFVHGTPSWSWEFREQIRDLRKTFRCIAPDHLGFGLSERPDTFDYRVASHRQNFAAFIDALHLDKFTLVVHDFGGPIALPYAIQHPERIQKLVILNSWYWPFEAADPAFARSKRWLTTPLMRFLYLQMNFSAQTMVKLSWGKHRPLDRLTHDSYRKLFPTPESRKSTWVLAQAMANTARDFTEYETQLAALKNLPTLLIWGAADQFVSQPHLAKWQALLPQAETAVLPKVGHFPADEAADRVTTLLCDFLCDS